MPTFTTSGSLRTLGGTYHKRELRELCSLPTNSHLIRGTLKIPTKKKTEYVGQFYFQKQCWNSESSDFEEEFQHTNFTHAQSF